MSDQRGWKRLGLALAVLATAPGLAAPFAYVTEAGASNVKVIDTADLRVVANIAVGASPTSVAINADGTRTYVVNSDAGTVSVIDTTTNGVAATIAVGAKPTSIAVNRSGTRVYVAHRGDGWSEDVVSVIDARSNAVVAGIGVGPGMLPRGLLVSPDGRRLYVANTRNSGISAIETITHTTVASTYQGTRPHGLAMDAEGTRIYATFPNRSPQLVAFDAASLAQVGSTSASLGSPEAIALDPAGTRVYVLDSGIDTDDGLGTVHVLDTATLDLLSRIAVGRDPQGIAVSPDGGRIYVTNRGSDNISVIDARALQVTSVIPVGRSPTSYGDFIGAHAATKAENYQGLWWNPSESGWGLSIAHQGGVLFATWFTYDLDGSPLWLVMSHGASTDAGTYSGTLYRTTGPWFAANFWNPAAVNRAAVGSARLSFTGPEHGTFTYTYGGVTRSKDITRQVFSSPMPTCTAGAPRPETANYQDLWWRSPAGSGSGWGMSIAHQGDTLFAIWFTYDASGRGMWVAMSNGVRLADFTDDDGFGYPVYEGRLFRMTGPPFDASPWDPTLVTRTAVGFARFIFQGSNRGWFTYELDQMTHIQAIERQVFSAPATVCR